MRRAGEMLGAASIQIAFNLGNALGAYFGGLPISFGLGPQYAALPGAADGPCWASSCSPSIAVFTVGIKLIEYCRKMKCADNREELFPVVDAAGRVVGRATRGECHGGSMLLHPGGAPPSVQLPWGALPAKTSGVEGYPARTVGYGRRRPCGLGGRASRCPAARGARGGRRDGFRAGSTC